MPIKLPAVLDNALGNLMILVGPKNPAVLYLANRGCSKFGALLCWHGDNSLMLRKNDRAMLLAPNHFIYASDMAQRFDTYFAPLKATQIGGYAVVDYSKPGILQTYQRSGLQFEMASFPEEDETIEEYCRWYVPKPGDTVFDIGAHCGVSVYHFSRLVGSQGRVIAFEPDPINFGLLLRNVARHKLTNVTCLQIAVAGTRGQATFHSEGTIGSSLKSASTRHTVGNSLLVDTITLADAYHKWGVPQFTKIDIEGSEIEVITASVALLAATDIQFALDTNHLVAGELTSLRIENLFRSAGFESETRNGTTWARPLTRQTESTPQLPGGGN